MSPINPALTVKRLASDRTSGTAKAASTTCGLITRLMFGPHNRMSSLALGLGQTRSLRSLEQFPHYSEGFLAL